MSKSINFKDIQGQAQLMSIPELEDYLLTKFDACAVDTPPSTEAELYQCYCDNTDYLYQYLRKVVGNWLFALSNEIRAMLGHMSDYRVSPGKKREKNLDKAYGHFRRLTLDAFKVLCDEFDKSLSRQMRQQYSYDYRDEYKNYLGDFAQQYVIAKQEYLAAQCLEKLGSDRDEHNIFELYYGAACKYIKLKQFYQQNKACILKVQHKAKFKKYATFTGAVFGLGMTLLEFVFS